ncbi:MAG TPA: hypothetical protein VHU80_09220 [Polyangiaceae bacterium]|nr:hypothetical protein [Polyangiaceae bacterium]
MRLRIAVALVLLSTAPCACKTEKDEAVRAEAGRVTRQIELLRGAANAAKAPYLNALEQTACAAPDVCQLRQVCVDAYTLQEKALASVASVRKAAEQTGSDVPEGASLVLSEAEAELARAKGMAGQCADLEGAVERKYSL